MKNISKYLYEYEYFCPCGNCSGSPPSFTIRNICPEMQELFDAFDHIREKWGKPIAINSGYRCPTYNASEGGGPLSVHQFGLALDLECSTDNEVRKMVAIIQQYEPNLRRGKYTGSKTFIHIDNGYEIYPKATRKWAIGKRW